MTKKICSCCGDTLVGVSCYDTGSNEHPLFGDSYAYNLFQCYNCGAVHMENVWENEGTFVLQVNGKVSKVGG